MNSNEFGSLALAADKMGCDVAMAYLPLAEDTGVCMLRGEMRRGQRQAPVYVVAEFTVDYDDDDGAQYKAANVGGGTSHFDFIAALSRYEEEVRRNA